MNGETIRIVHYEVSELAVRVVVRTELVESALVVAAEATTCPLCNSRVQPFAHHMCTRGAGKVRA
jgi:hypothetical protein